MHKILQVIILLHLVFAIGAAPARAVEAADYAEGFDACMSKVGKLRRDLAQEYCACAINRIGVMIDEGHEGLRWSYDNRDTREGAAVGKRIITDVSRACIKEMLGKPRT